MSEHLTTLIDWRKGDNVTTEAFNAAVDAAIAALSGLGEYAACCDTPHYCSSERRCTRLDAPQPVTPAGWEVVTDHGRKALDRCIRELTNFIKLADDYDLDEMSVQALQTAIESMQLRLTHPPVADAALVRDAERYRWLRDNHGASANGVVLDASVDAAMQYAALNQRGGGDHG